jgi:transcription initiation factor IIE alpha subunit
MARKRTTQIVLDDEQIAILTKISKSKTEEIRRVQRANIILMASNGITDDNIAKDVSLNKNSVRNTISKFTSMGLQASLSDLRRSGRPAIIGDDDKA